MNRNNYLKMEFPSYAGNEGFARMAVASFASQLNPTLEEMGEIRTAVSEAVSNCILHAYPNEIGDITLCCRIPEDNLMSIMIKDRGVGFQGMPEEHGGMGFLIMKSYMTELKVVSVPGKGTTVHMIRKLKRLEDDEYAKSKTEETELCHT
jgi:stage II sporulation protein AB (anti-sigma F factor)